MLINLRNALMAGKRLPYDAEVEYLESTGTQWINTGIDTSTISKYVTDTAMLGVGAEGSNVIPYIFIGIHASNVFYGYVGLLSSSPTAIPADHDRHIFEAANTGVVANDGFYIDGVKAKDRGTGTVASAPFYLFACYQPGNLRFYLRQRKYTAKIYCNGVLVRDFIPVRVGTVGYMYDRVSGKLFGNQGTGDFVLGQDVVPVEYIESTGTQRILTDIYTDANTAINCKASGTSGSFFGVLPSSTTAWWTILPNGFGKLRYYYGGSGATDVATIDATVPHDYQCSNKVLVDGVEAISLSRTLGSANVPLSLFARTASSGTSFTSLLVGRMWYLQIIQGGAIVRSFRSVRVGTEGALMDVLTRRIYRNAGTGAFGYGNDLKYPIPSE